ncbi:MAG: hypothetical protein RLZZ298_3142 [Pseudomonadota bacterium]|jgi:hypothetical protein
MSPELIFGIVIVAVFVLFFVSKLFPKPQPKEKHFQCARCGAISRHTERTIEAWRNKKAKFFCQNCHGKWLKSQPPQARESFSSHDSNRVPSGCLGVIMLFAFVPLAGYFLVRVYV